MRMCADRREIPFASRAAISCIVAWDAARKLKGRDAYRVRAGDCRAVIRVAPGAVLRSNPYHSDVMAPDLVKVDADGIGIAYREMGEGSPVLLLHGWPTSSFLWRNVMPAIARSNRVVAIDLPGFGASDKPAGADYDFDFYATVIDSTLAALEIDSLGLAVHDLGGPVGLDWARRNQDRVSRIALLNTLVYPEFCEAVVEFVAACSKPDTREFLTSPQGLEAAMRLGLADESKLTRGAIEAVQKPFGDQAAREALADTGKGLSMEGFTQIGRWVPNIAVPVRVIYGAQDHILPDIAETMERFVGDVPQAEITVLEDCGHFLQEEEPQKIGDLLADFFAKSPPSP